MRHEVEFRRTASSEFDVLDRSDAVEVLLKLETIERGGVSNEIKAAEIDSAPGHYEVHVLFPPCPAIIVMIHATESMLISVTHITAVNGLGDAQKLRFAQEAAAAIGVVPTNIRII